MEDILPVETNILIFDLAKDVDPEMFLRKLKASGILAVSLGGQSMRFVTHLDFDDVQPDALDGILTCLDL